MSSTLAARHERATQSCALFHLEDWQAVAITGKDARDFLNRISTQDLRGLSAGQATQSLFLRGDGRLVADTVVLCRADGDFLLLCPKLCLAPLLDQLEKFHFSEELNFHEQAGLYIGLICGPRQDLLSERVGLPGQEISRWSASLAPGGQKTFVVCEQPVFSARASEIYTAVEELGGVVGDVDLYHAMRIEEARPQFGAELDEKVIPLEAGLKPAISFTKGCFPGQEIVARINNLGHPANVLVPVVLPETTEKLVGRALLLDTKTVGRVTSAGYSPLLRRALGLAYVKWNQRESGTVLRLEGNQEFAAQVIAPPAAEVQP